MTNLAAFLLARIAEDEATAQECVKHGLRTFNDYRTIESDSGGYIWWAPPMHAGPWAAFVDQVEAWDPARVLAECDAKRRIIDLAFEHAATIDNEWGCVHTAEQIRAGKCDEERPDDQELLRLLALPYTDHPAFREEWKP